jgi:RNA polymerase sigma factor (sigma-70 family)
MTLGALPIDVTIPSRLLAAAAAGRPMTQTVAIATARDDSHPVADDATAEFVSLYEVHYSRLVRSLQISGADRTAAEDMAQEAFARTLGHWRRVRKGTNPPGYVYRTAFRLARRRLPTEVLLGDEVSTPDVAGEAITNVTLTAALDAMPPRRRACAILCFVGGLTPNEVGEALGIAAGTVRKQLEHARAELGVQLDR